MEVGLGERSYEIVIGRGLADELRRAVDDLRSDDHPVAAVVDAGFASAQASFLEDSLGDVPKMELPSGEATKSLASIGRIWDFLAEAGMDRTGRLFVMGGKGAPGGSDVAVLCARPPRCGPPRGPTSTCGWVS